jgi:sugar O-acyltransferase (sialic acid O-acetyltransferase NeuD family)
MEIFIFGSGAQGRIVLDILRTQDNLSKISFIDDNSLLWGKNINGAIVKGGTEYLIKQDSSAFKAIIALGDPNLRKKIFNSLTEKGVQFTNAVHPSAVIMPSAKIGLGNMIFAGAIINTNSVIGNCTIINTTAVIEHDCIVEDFASISPGVQVGGRVNIKNSAFIGTGAIILARKNIGTFAVVAAGAIVTKDVEDRTLVMGIPAKKVSQIDDEFEWKKLF